MIPFINKNNMKSESIYIVLFISAESMQEQELFTKYAVN